MALTRNEQAKRQGRGGRRIGAGRKSDAVEELTADDYSRLKKAQADREEHRAKLAALEVAQKEGDLVPAAQVKADADRASRIVRDTLLAMPDRVAALLLGLDERQMANLLRAEVRGALEHISAALARK